MAAPNASKVQGVALISDSASIARRIQCSLVARGTGSSEVQDARTGSTQKVDNDFIEMCIIDWSKKRTEEQMVTGKG